MAKSLGKIHTVNYALNNVSPLRKNFLCDLSKELTQQLGHMVRNSNSVKLVGLDMSVSEYGGTGDAQVSGFIRYFSPTKGRVEAYKKAYNAVRMGMKMNGINIKGNKLYDFRLPLQNRELYANGDDFVNCAAIGGADGDGEISLGSQLQAGLGDEIPFGENPYGFSAFGVYNQERAPVATNEILHVSTGYGIATPTGKLSDFVSNEGFYWDGMKDNASEEMEMIPFQLSWSPLTDESAFTFNWRPDPALYLSLMCGQFDIVVDEMDGDGLLDSLSIDVAVHVAGWTPLLGGKKRGRKYRGKRRRKSKK